MKATFQDPRRTDAVKRATTHSPFLRAASERWPDIARKFLSDGAEAAVIDARALSGDGVAVTLRRQHKTDPNVSALQNIIGQVEELSRDRG